jgi:hypothetical protein
VIAELEKAGLEYFNPQKDDWKPEDAETEAVHLASDRILVFAVTGETFGVASLAEIGLAAAAVARSNRTLVVYVAPEVVPDEAFLQGLDSGARVRDSNNARKIVLAHLRKMTMTEMGVILVDDLADIAPKAIQAAAMYRQADSIQAMIRYGKDGRKPLNYDVLWAVVDSIPEGALHS